MPQIVVPTSFTDGALIRQADLNTLTYDVDQLCQITTGAPASAGRSVKPAVRLSLSGAQAVASGVPNFINVVTWGIDLYDSDNLWSSAHPDHIVVNTPGWYRIQAQIWWDAATSGPTNCERTVQLLVNGEGGLSGQSSSSSNIPSNGSGAFQQSVISTERLAAGAAVYTGIFQHTGSNLNILPNGTWGTSFCAIWEAPY